MVDWGVDLFPDEGVELAERAILERLVGPRGADAAMLIRGDRPRLAVGDAAAIVSCDGVLDARMDDVAEWAVVPSELLELRSTDGSDRVVLLLVVNDQTVLVSIFAAARLELVRLRVRSIRRELLAVKSCFSMPVPGSGRSGGSGAPATAHVWARPRRGGKAS